MRFEIILFAITAFIIANIYTDGKYIKLLYSGKKYWQMAGVAFGALMLYTLFKSNPVRAREMLSTSSDYVKYLPIDRETSSFISPILDFTSKHGYDSLEGQMDSLGGFNYPIVPISNTAVSENRIMESGKKGTKRSVSETKKKFVASRQNWHCGDCGEQLPAWFEVDHKIRLEVGGSNHIDNLVALCRDCHGKKTAMENL
uniref:HNH nuclease domain-containing protein n=1 Tax=viral metagenome TaxID=1070528 RepID=A0A6C0I4M9_9ZZZZ